MDIKAWLRKDDKKKIIYITNSATLVKRKETNFGIMCKLAWPFSPFHTRNEYHFAAIQIIYFQIKMLICICRKTTEKLNYGHFIKFAIGKLFKIQHLIPSNIYFHLHIEIRTVLFLRSNYRNKLPIKRIL